MDSLCGLRSELKQGCGQRNRALEHAVDQGVDQIRNIDGRLLRFLVDTIRPKVIVVHGKPAVEAVAKLNLSSRVIATDHHFSRKTSRETARALGARAAALIRETTQTIFLGRVPQAEVFRHAGLTVEQEEYLAQPHCEFCIRNAFKAAEST